MKNNAIHIRSARADDASALARLLRSIGWFERMEGESEERTVEYVGVHLRQSLADDSHTILVAENIDGAIIGYVAVHWLPYLFKTGPEGFISELFVHESARGVGVGTRLLEEVVREAGERKCSRLQLINFRQRESYQRGFYTKLGWEERPMAASFVYDLSRPGQR